MISSNLETFYFVLFLSFYQKMQMTFDFHDTLLFSLLLKYQLLSSHYLSPLFHFYRFNILDLGAEGLLFVNFSDGLDIDADLSYNHYGIFVIEQIFQKSHLLLFCLFGKFEDILLKVYSISIRLQDVTEVFVEGYEFVE